jgi:hypothetical protein
MYHKALRRDKHPPAGAQTPPGEGHATLRGLPHRDRGAQRARAATPKNNFTSRSALAVLSEA